MKTKNPNWKETPEGYVRDENATPTKGQPINWNRADSVQQIRQSVAELREQQNQRNEEYRRKHGG
jgi:hypothetical protein